MSDHFDIRSYEPGDENGLVNQLIEGFDGWPKFDITCSAYDHWKWKYIDNPSGVNIIGIASIDGVIIGCEHGFNQKVKIGEQIVYVRQSTDSTIHTDFRGKGLYSKINEFTNKVMKEKDTNYTFWATTNEIISTMANNRGYPKFPVKINNMIRIKDFQLHKEKASVESPLIKEIGYNTLKTINKISQYRITRSTKDKDIKIKDIELFSDEVNDFWAEIKDDYNFIFLRDQTNLNWRFCDPRGGKYFIKQAEKDGKVLGYIVYRFNMHNENYPVATIADMLYLPNRDEVGDLLLKETIKEIDDLGINVIYSWCITKHPHEILLKHNGFILSTEKLDVRCRKTTAGEEREQFISSNPEQLHVMIGDTDWI